MFFTLLESGGVRPFGVSLLVGGFNALEPE